MRCELTGKVVDSCGGRTAASSCNNNNSNNNTDSQSTTTKTATTTTTDGSATRHYDTNARRWFHTAVNSAGERPRPSRAHQTLLNHRPNSTVLDAIRAIEARQQLPLSDPTAHDAENRHSMAPVDRRMGCRLVDIVRRPVLVESLKGSLHPATRRFAYQQLCQVRGQDLGQGHLEGQSSL